MNTANRYKYLAQGLAARGAQLVVGEVEDAEVGERREG